MKTAKQALVACWIIIIVSFIGIVIVRTGIDIRLQEQITKTQWIYDNKTREFYQGIWSNIFTGAIVAVATAHITYLRTKHDVEFRLKMSEQMLTISFSLLSSNMYVLNLAYPQNNHIAIARFSHAITETHSRYDRMIEAANDYCPFFKTKKARIFVEAKCFLQDLWVDICSVEDDLITYESEASLKRAIDKTKETVQKKEEKLKKVHDEVWKY